MATFQPTLPARGATTADDAPADVQQISTHAPRTGSDLGENLTADSVTFQPTLPARGATVTCYLHGKVRCDFNPRSPHGERQ